MANFKLLEDMSLPNKGIINYLPGDIIMINSTTIPDGWLPCDGQTLSTSDYPELYSVLGEYYWVGALPALYPYPSFMLPDLNNQTSSFNKYVVGTVGNATGWTEPTYPFHTHASDTGYQVDAVGVARLVIRLLDTSTVPLPVGDNTTELSPAAAVNNKLAKLEVNEGDISADVVILPATLALETI
jgi:microcystin-dependent protein